MFTTRHQRPQCFPFSSQHMGECNRTVSAPYPWIRDFAIHLPCDPKKSSCSNIGGSQLKPFFQKIPSYKTRDKPSWNQIPANPMKAKHYQMQWKIRHFHLHGVGQGANPISHLHPQKPLPRISSILSQLSSIHRSGTLETSQTLWAKKGNGPVNVARMGLAESIQWSLIIVQMLQHQNYNY